MEFAFEAEIWHWRGPAPHHFVTLPADATEPIEDLAPMVSYGWGMIPVQVRLAETEWATALFPKDGRYILPLKAAVRQRHKVDVGDRVEVRVTVVRPDAR